MSRSSTAAAPARVPKGGGARRVSVRAVPASPRRVRTITVLGIMLGLIVLFGSVVFHALIAQLQVQMNDVDGRISDVEHANQEKQVTIAELEAPDRIRLLATTQLGMVEPDPAAIVHLELLPADALSTADGAPGQ